MLALAYISLYHSLILTVFGVIFFFFPFFFFFFFLLPLAFQSGGLKMRTQVIIIFPSTLTLVISYLVRLVVLAFVVALGCKLLLKTVIL